ncbi:MAG: hypothetical protein ACREPV_05010 [Lysobacter sp.]
MASAFERFLTTRRSDLQRISRRTRGEHSLDDVISEAWLTASEIGQRRGWAFEFGDQDDQDQLFAWLHVRLVKYADKTVRYAIRLDDGDDDDDGERIGATLARLLTAPLDTDPQVRQQLIEEREQLLDRLRRSYSQATAYVLLLMRVDGHLSDLAELLRVTIGTLRDRMKRVGLVARIQPTLFDGIERIALDFHPWQKRRHAISPVWPAKASQLELWQLTRPATRGLDDKGRPEAASDQYR